MSAVYRLLAFPGTGKLTIAKEIVAKLDARGEPCGRLDNHATHNLVWQLVDEQRRFDPAVLDKVLELRRLAIDGLTAGEAADRIIAMAG